MNDLHDLWVVNYSSFDDNFNIEVLVQSVRNNAETLLAGGTTTYFPIVILESSDDATKFVEEFRKKLNKLKKNKPER